MHNKFTVSVCSWNNFVTTSRKCYSVPNVSLIAVTSPVGVCLRDVTTVVLTLLSTTCAGDNTDMSTARTPSNTRKIHYLCFNCNTKQGHSTTFIFIFELSTQKMFILSIEYCYYSIFTHQTNSVITIIFHSLLLRGFIECILYVMRHE